MAAALSSCFGWLEQRMTLPDASRDDVNRNLVMLIWTASGVFLLAIGAMLSDALYGNIVGTVGCLGHLGLALYALWRREVTERCVRVIMFVSCICILAFDLSMLTVHMRAYPLYVLMLDCLLAVRADGVSKVVVAFTCVYLLISELELTYRFGLLDIPSMLSYEKRRALADCERPPCERDGFLTVPRGLAVSYLVFILDYYLTRRFANRLVHEKEQMAVAVEAAEHISKSLASFDLDAAETFLTERSTELPVPLLFSLQKLLANLSSYRPYLPNEFFCEDSSSEEAHSRQSVTVLNGFRSSLDGDAAVQNIPGMRTSDSIAVVFSDIRQSTALWDNNDMDVMRTALTRHNDIMRAAIEQFNGYEVKTIGDAFMITFHDAVDAVRFSLKVQTEHGQQGTFPEALKRPGAGTDGYAVFSVRIGINYGEACTEKNVLTGRYDYFGTTVNKAARVESNGISGAVTVTQIVMDCLPHDLLDGVITVRYTHKRMAKGLSEPLWLTALLPRALEAMEPQVRLECEKVPPEVSAGGVVSVKSPSPALYPTSSGMSEMCYTPARVNHHTGRLRSHMRSDAVIAVCKYMAWDGHVPFRMWESVDDARTRRLQLIDKHLRDTRGHMCTVINSYVVMSWGVQRVCQQHVNESARFIMRLYESLTQQEPGMFSLESSPVSLIGVNTRRPLFHMGVAAGAVATNEVAVASAQRFVTVLGPTVDLAFMLCNAAADLATDALLAASGEESDAAIHDRSSVLTTHLRPVDEWSFEPLAVGAAGGGVLTARTFGDAWSVDSDRVETCGPPLVTPTPVTVYELNVRSLLDAAKESSHSTSPRATFVGIAAGGGWTPAYRRAYAAEDPAGIRDAAGPNDAIAHRVAQRMEQGTHFQHALMHCDHPAGVRRGVPPQILSPMMSPQTPELPVQLRMAGRMGLSTSEMIPDLTDDRDILELPS